jgi:D-alanyl-D-alanine carboxypeptidase (penicillin-binding protein 5/6)
VVERADVWLGMEPNVPLVIERDLKLTLPRKLRRKMVAKVIYKGPIPAPLLKGTPVARLVVSVPERDPIEVPLVAGAAVRRLGLIGRLGAAVNYLLWGGAR